MKLNYLIIFLAISSLTCTKKVEFTNPIDADIKLLQPTEVLIIASADTLVTVKWKDSNTYPENTVVTYLIETDTTSGTFAQVGVSSTGTSEAVVPLELKIGRQYIFRMRIQVDKKYSEYSEQKIIQIQFTEPINVTLTAEADTAVVVSWQYTGTFQTGFEIERQIGSDAFVKIGSISSSILTFKDTVALIVGHQYIYRVRALSRNNMSSYSVNSSLTATFIDPTNVTLTAKADTAVVVSWQYSGMFQIGFEVERKIGNGVFTKVGTGKFNDRNYNDVFPLTIGQQYSYRIRALSKNNVSGYASSTALTVSLTDPTNVTLTPQADTAVVVNWQYTGTFQTGFEIERQVGNGIFVKVGTTIANVLTFKDNFILLDGQQYSYRIRAITKNNVSAHSPISILSYSFLPPNNLSISSITEISIGLTWTKANDFSKTIIIEKSNNGIEFIVIDSLTSTSSTIKTISGIYSTDTMYSFRLRAKSNNNISAYSNTASEKLIFLEPTNLQLLLITASQVKLSWIDNSSFETGFNIEQSIDGGNYSIIKSENANITTSTINAIYDSMTTYSFRVKAKSQYNLTKYSNLININMMLAVTAGGEQMIVNGGSYTMGSDIKNMDYEASPSHTVTLSDYYIGKYEVTQKLWKEVVEWKQGSATSPLNPKPSNFTSSELLPVEKVSWNDIQIWLGYLNQKTGLSNSLNKYRLPTEAEWEYAARGGSHWTDNYPYSGSLSLGDVGWWNGNSGSSGTHLVGTKKSNQIGTFDMTGNVLEWCNDWYGSYSNTTQTNPTGPSSGITKVFRGGSFANNEGVVENNRIANRPFGFTPTTVTEYLGFRLVRTK